MQESSDWRALSWKIICYMKIPRWCWKAEHLLLTAFFWSRSGALSSPSPQAGWVFLPQEESRCYSSEQGTVKLQSTDS